MDRNFSEELRAAAAANDWDAHARIWEERRVAEVDADEAGAAAGQDYEAYLDAGMEDGCPNEDGMAPAPFDPEAQGDLDRHNAEFFDGYR